MGVGAVAAGAAWAYDAVLRRPLPRTRGLEGLPGLEAAVEVVRDPWGVPHIRAASLGDAYAALGFVQAQDRLWQLDLNRRVGHGRLSELFGERALAADRFLRRIGLRRAAEREALALDAGARRLLEQYGAGVNAAMRAARALPIEFRLLGARPEPWTVVDSLAYAKLMAWTLSANWETELLRVRLASRLGPERAARFEPVYPAGHPLSAPPEAEAAAADLMAAFAAMAEFLPLFASGASNAWAVSAERSATGRPLLAADPHLRLQMPSVWYEVHLSAPEVDVAGAALVGLPGVVIGHNGALAWGVTAAPVDVQDLYIEQFDPRDPTRYEVNGEWREAALVSEVIQVRGRSEPVIEQVRLTRHGPIVTAPDAAAALALRWTSAEPDHFVETITAVNQARSWEAARAALADLHGPPVNIICADAAGTIAYQLVGHIPTRPGGNGLTPAPGWSDDFEWGSPIPFDELPCAINPPDGVVISANNAVGGNGYPHYLGHDWSNGYRAKRIATLLAERQRHRPADFARIQGDVLSLPGLRLQDRLARLAPTGLTPAGRRVQALIQAWDGEMGPESRGAAAYGRLAPIIVRRLFEESLGELLPAYLGVSAGDLGSITVAYGRAMPLALDLLDDPVLGGLPVRLPEPPAGMTRSDALLAASLDEAAADLARLLGSDPDDWRWGALHRVAWRHPLGAIKALEPFLSRGPFEIGGDGDTVNYGASVPFPPEGIATDAWVAGYRLIVDLAAPERSISLLAGGQSGLPNSKHYADQVGAWVSSRYHALLYDRTAIDRAALGRLLLVPADEGQGLGTRG
jgi:penicillin amidase